MTSYLLPTTATLAGPRRKGAYCTILTDIIRASSDAHCALDTFSSLLLGDSSSGFAKFDAHVGETGCHLRATMLRDVFFSCRGRMSESGGGGGQVTTRNEKTGGALLPDWIVATMRDLCSVRKNAEELCSQLTKNRVDPRRFGLSRREETPQHIIQVLSGNLLPGTEITAASVAPSFQLGSLKFL